MIASWIIFIVRLPDAVLSGLSINSDSLTAKVKAFNQEHDVDVISRVAQSTATPTKTTTSTTTPKPSPTRPLPPRTVCQPTFDSPKIPMNLESTGVPHETLPLEEFETKHELFDSKNYECFDECRH